MNWSFQRVLTRALIEDGAKLPWGYGFAWRDFDTASHVTYPIPFNVLFRGLRRLYHWILSYKHSVLDEARIDGIVRGQEIQKLLQEKQDATRKLLK